MDIALHDILFSQLELNVQNYREDPGAGESHIQGARFR